MGENDPTTRQRMRSSESETLRSYESKARRRNTLLMTSIGCEERDPSILLSSFLRLAKVPQLHCPIVLSLIGKRSTQVIIPK